MVQIQNLMYEEHLVGETQPTFLCLQISQDIGFGVLKRREVYQIFVSLRPYIFNMYTFVWSKSKVNIEFSTRKPM